MKKKEINQEIPAQATEEQVFNAVQNVNPDVVLRNLAFWLDIAIARGRFVDYMAHKQSDKSQDDALSASDKDTE